MTSRVVLLVLCIGVASSLVLDAAVDHELITAINAKGASSWVAGVNDNFVGLSKSDVKKLLGWRPPSTEEKARKLPTGALGESKVALPQNFTSADNWPACRTIRTIYNQARCGSCWAFGGVESVSDRFCIASKGAFNQILSFGEVTECTSGGCDGGSAEATYSYFQYNGGVTGACYPYYVPTCPPAQQPCLNFVDTPNCWTNSSCVNGASWTKYFISNYYGYDSNQQTMTDMYANGPVEACFDVYADFLNYKSGVYVHTSGDFLGGHCVKVQGWGIEKGMPYWLVNNSWTTSWGDNGQFKILRGQDECGIEDGMVGGTPIWPPSQ